MVLAIGAGLEQQLLLCGAMSVQEVFLVCGSACPDDCSCKGQGQYVLHARQACTTSPGSRAAGQCMLQPVGLMQQPGMKPHQPLDLFLSFLS